MTNTSFFSTTAVVSLLPPSILDLNLVALSILIGITSSVFALYVISLGKKSDDEKIRNIAAASGALAFGLGVWAMHFLGMLALRLCVRVSYDPMITALSVLPALLAAYVAIRVLLTEQVSKQQLLLSGTLLGLGVGIMHYAGMQAMVMTTALRFEPFWFGMSLLVAVVLGNAALWLSYSEILVSLNKWQRLLASGIVLGLSISGMHYAAMKSAIFVGAPTTAIAVAPDGTRELAVAILIAVLVVFLCVGGINLLIRFKELLAIANAAKAELVEAVARLEQSEQNLEERVLKRTLELESATKAAQDASRVKSEFLATMSHEIRTPMDGVLGMTELLLESKLNAEQTGYARNILHSGQALLSIINDILDLSKIEAGHMAYEAHVFSLEALLDSITTGLRMRAQAKGIAFDVDLRIPPQSHYIGDSLRVRQVLFNLLGNAVKFTHRGQVQLLVMAQPFGLRFEVRDSGIGIAPDDLSKLFSSFVQVDSSTSRTYGGTGLGLVICKKLVEGMQGTIGVTSEAGKGSCFWFELPMKEANSVLSAEANTSLGVNHAAAMGSSAVRKVLLVEDHPINQKLATVILERLGYAVDLAPDGAQGVRAALAKQYDVILMDVQMPVLNGFDATRAIRNGSGPNCRTPIIALTANAMESDKNTCLQSGMNDFLTKPYTKEALAKCIEEQLQYTD